MKKKILTFSLFLIFCIGLYAQPKVVGEPRMIAKTSEPLQRPVWSPDGAKLLLNYGQWEVSVDGTNLRQASANQLKATICTNPLLLQMIDNPDGVADKVEMLKSLSGYIIFNPVLSPKGDKIAFQAGNGLYVCDADCQADVSTLRKFDKGERATWTPDGKYLVVMCIEDDGYVVTKGELYSINAATGVRSLLLSSDKYVAVSPAISPDGKKLAFENYADGAIYVMDIQY